MTDISVPDARRHWHKIAKAGLAFAGLIAMIAVFDAEQLRPTAEFAIKALWNTFGFIAFAVAAVAYMKATGAETLLARAFEGRETRMIILAAFMGGLSPFCSCEVIPFIAAMLALGAPLSAVMAFWLSSPLMDPAMFLITSGTLGWGFAVAKTAAAVALGLFGGFATKLFFRTVVFAQPLREKPQAGVCCGARKPYQGKPVWGFWAERERVGTFRENAIDNGLFLLKWLALAYVIEAVMIRYIPAETIATILGGDGLGPILLGALVGMPAYLNGYAAVPLIDGLLEQGMAQGAAMSFIIAGGVSSIPAAIAVWALVKPRVFAAYIGLAIIGAVFAGFAWQTVA
ncbi:MAG: permease [Roseovarius sp.]|nr:permease [Roseovarius sp.]